VYDKVFYSIAAREIILEWDKTACRFVFFLLDLDLPFLKRTWTRTWTCPLKVDLDLDLDLRIRDLDLDLAVAGLVTSLIRPSYIGIVTNNSSGHKVDLPRNNNERVHKLK